MMIERQPDIKVSELRVRIREPPRLHSPGSSPGPFGHPAPSDDRCRFKLPPTAGSGSDGRLTSSCRRGRGPRSDDTRALIGEARRLRGGFEPIETVPDTPPPAGIPSSGAQPLMGRSAVTAHGRKGGPAACDGTQHHIPGDEVEEKQL